MRSVLKPGTHHPFPWSRCAAAGHISISITSFLGLVKSCEKLVRSLVPRCVAMPAGMATCNKHKLIPLPGACDGLCTHGTHPMDIAVMAWGGRWHWPVPTRPSHSSHVSHHLCRLTPCNQQFNMLLLNTLIILFLSDIAITRFLCFDAESSKTLN